MLDARRAVVLDGILLADWISNGFRLTDLSYPGVLGLLLIVLGFQTFTFAILLQMLGRARAATVSGARPRAAGGPRVSTGSA